MMTSYRLFCSRSCKGGKREWLYEHIRPRSRVSDAMTSSTSQFTPLRKPLMTSQKRPFTTMVTSSKQSNISTVEVICGSKSESSSSGDVVSSLSSPVTSLGDDDDDDVTKKVATWKLLQVSDNLTTLTTMTSSCDLGVSS